MRLCVCECCGTIMKDYTPTQKSIDFTEAEMKYIETSPPRYDEDAVTWNCPICFTDVYLKVIEERCELLEMDYV